MVTGEQRAGGSSEPVHLKRNLGLLSSLAVIIGTTIGSGIFVSPAGVLERSGSVGLSLVIWVCCGLLSMLGGLCYIELGLLIPKAGGEFVYFHDGLGPLHEFWGRLPAFLFSWMGNLIIRPSSTAILALTFAEYAIVPFYDTGCSPPATAVTLLAILVICTVSFVSYSSLALATATQNILTFSKLVALAIIIGVGAVWLAQGSTQNLTRGFDGSSQSPSEIATAFYSGLWAYDGWNTLNYLAEEVSDPARNLPRAIVMAMCFITVIYLLVNIAYMAVMSPALILSSPAVAVTFADMSLGPAAFLVPLGVVLSVYGSLNGSIMASARICFSSSREGQFVKSLGFVHAERRIPSPAILFHSMVTIVMIVCSDINQLIDFFSFAIWMFYGVSMSTLLVLRWRWPKAERPYRVATVVPCFMLLVSVYLVIAPIVAEPQIGYVYVLLFMMLGSIVYYTSVYRRWTPSFMPSVNYFLQKLLTCVPADFEGKNKQAVSASDN